MGWYPIACHDRDASRLNARPGTAYGVDGCSAGWFCYGLTAGGGRRYRIAVTFEELIYSADDRDRFFVDIPIGLPRGAKGHLCGKEGSKGHPCDSKPCEVRQCDRDARAELGRPRSSSVFSAPVCAALHAETHEEANRISRVVSGKGMSRQTYALLPKIREVDRLLRDHAASTTGKRKIGKAGKIEVREVHPEICFWALAGRKAMKHSKKKREGFQERIECLKGILPCVEGDFDEIRETFPKRVLANDDILDAMAAAATASADRDSLGTLPECPPLDCCGLPMEMVYRMEP